MKNISKNVKHLIIVTSTLSKKLFICRKSCHQLHPLKSFKTCRTTKVNNWYKFTGDFKLQTYFFPAADADFFCCCCFKEGYKYELFNNEHHKSGSNTHSYQTIHSCKDVTDSLELTGMGFLLYYKLQLILTSKRLHQQWIYRQSSKKPWPSVFFTHFSCLLSLQFHS